MNLDQLINHATEEQLRTTLHQVALAAKAWEESVQPLDTFDETDMAISAVATDITETITKGLS